MKNATKKSIFIIGLLIVFIACVWVGSILVQTTENPNKITSQSVEVSKIAQDKTEIKSDNKNKCYGTIGFFI